MKEKKENTNNNNVNNNAIGGTTMNNQLKDILDSIDFEGSKPTIKEIEMNEPTNTLVIVGTGHRINAYPGGKGSEPVQQFTDEQVEAMRYAFASKLAASNESYDEVIYFHGNAHGFDRESRLIAEAIIGKDNVKGRHPNYYMSKGKDAWQVIGKTAGTWRNHRMLEEAQELAAKMGAKVVCAAWLVKEEFSGTQHCVNAATAKGIEVVRIAS